MKVLITVRNKTKRPLRGISILDTVPPVIKAPAEFGIIKPKQSQQTNQGTKMLWELPELGAGQERVISYKIETKMQVLGKLKLPGAAAKLKLKKRKFVLKSSSCTITEKK